MNSQTRRAFLVGINKYKPKITPKSPYRTEWTNLRGCINDVEAMKAILLSSLFDFKPENVHVLKNEAATKTKILADFKRILIDSTSTGDICFFYFSGHGSRVKNSKSKERDKMDETLVPADWYQGVGDIHDKQLKKLFNQVLDKDAHLTVIVDACHSGSISRGIPVPWHYRFLPPDQFDIAQSPEKGKSPAQRGAFIFSAAQDFQGAVETRDENNNWHGLFTWALIRTVQNHCGHASAQDDLLKTRALMQTERPSQVPNLEGPPHKTKCSTILGLPANQLSGSLTVAVSRVRHPMVELMGGLALGLRKDCQLKKIVEKNRDAAIRVQVTAMHGLNRSTAKIIPSEFTGSEPIKVGDLFALDKWVAAREAQLQIYVPTSPYSRYQLLSIASKISELQESPHIDWIQDPTGLNPTHIISWQESSWILQISEKNNIQTVRLGKNPRKERIQKEILNNSPGKNIKPRVFLCLPLSKETGQRLRSDMENYLHINQVSDQQEGIHYILVGRFTGKGIQYAWVLPNMTRDEKQDFMLPVITDWINIENNENQLQKKVEKITDKILQLASIRAWLQLSSPPGDGRFPYRLAIRNDRTGKLNTTGPLIQDEIYGLVLQADKNRFKSGKPIQPIQQRYVYAFAIDSNGKGTLLYPPLHLRTADNCFPINPDDTSEEIELGNKRLFRIKEPFGVDTFILITTTDALLNPAVLDFAGVRRESPKGKLTPLEELFFDLSIPSRSLRRHLLPMDWSIQRLPILSRSKK